jgi:hypothetical protein
VLTAGSRTKTPVDRNIKQAGVMAKDIGQQASYGVPYESFPTVMTSKSSKPNEKTIRRLTEQSQLRMEVKKYTPGSFCYMIIEDFFDSPQRSKPSTSPLCKGFSLTLHIYNM